MNHQLQNIPLQLVAIDWSCCQGIVGVILFLSPQNNTIINNIQVVHGEDGLNRVCLFIIGFNGIVSLSRLRIRTKPTEQTSVTNKMCELYKSDKELCNNASEIPVYLCENRTFNCKNMSKILFIGGFILIIAWAIGFFGFHISGVIHILPAIAIIGFIIRLIYNKSFVKNKY